MNLSLEEINLQLEERPHDLTVWREWLSYCRRHDLPHDRYIDYLEKEGIIKEDGRSRSWEIYRGKDLDLLRGVVAPDLELLLLSYPEMESTEGIEDLIAVNLKATYIRNVRNLEVTKIFSSFGMSDSKIRFSDTVDPNVLTKLSLSDKVEIENLNVIYEALNLTTLTVQDYDGSLGLKLDKLKKLTTLNIFSLDTEILKKLGDSLYLKHMRGYTVQCNEILKLMKENWYPNLEFPVKGVYNQ